MQMTGDAWLAWWEKQIVGRWPNAVQGATGKMDYYEALRPYSEADVVEALKTWKAGDRGRFLPGLGEVVDAVKAIIRRRQTSRRDVEIGPDQVPPHIARRHLRLARLVRRHERGGYSETTYRVALELLTYLMSEGRRPDQTEEQWRNHWRGFARTVKFIGRECQLPADQVNTEVGRAIHGIRELPDHYVWLTRQDCLELGYTQADATREAGIHELATSTLGPDF